MIPKIIHYCWFGRGELSPLASKCIKSWKKYFPDYKIVEWNEDNYDIQSKPIYVQEAYKAKKYAFVSDYARFDILYKNGGVYFDTDVEVIKSFDDIMKNGAFMGFETDTEINPGLGIAADSGLNVYKEIIDSYEDDRFINNDGSYNLETIVTRVTRILKYHGLTDVTGMQKVCEITIYPTDFFCPLSYSTNKMHKTKDTHSIHWFDASWKSRAEKKAHKEWIRKKRINDVKRQIKKALFLE